MANNFAMHLHYLNEKPSLLTHFLNELRDIEIQKEKGRFRKNLEKIGSLMAYEMSKHLDYKPIAVTTPLGQKASHDLLDNVVVLSILRAGLALHQGFIAFLNTSDHGFISAYREHSDEFHFEIKVEYVAVPDLKDKILWIVDPMLATGKSIVEVIKHLQALHQPKEIHLAVVVAAPEGIAYLQKQLPEHVHLWMADVDNCLNEHQYIVPGLGDAGDLAYGVKL